MRILQLCKKFPYPLKDGESIAVSSMSKALNELGCQMSLLAMNTTKHHTDLKTLPADYDQYENIFTVNWDNSMNAWQAFKNIFSSDSFHIDRYISSSYNQKLIEILQRHEFDVIQLETLYLTPYIETIKQYSNAIISMRAHNIESEIWKRITDNTSFLPKKVYLRHLTQKLENYELKHLNDYDYLVTVSERDLKEFKKLGYKNGAMSSPIGLPLNKYNKLENNTVHDIGFIGSMDWKPNVEGVEWFVKEVLPLINNELPDAKLHVAGRNSSSSLTSINKPNVKIHGEVDDAIEFMQDAKLMIVPLFSGSGTRVKILEAMALRKSIVTTSIGLEGIEAKNEEHLLVANDSSAFANAIIRLLKNKGLRDQLGVSANEFVKDQYDSHSNAKILLNKYQQLLKLYPKSISN